MNADDLVTESQIQSEIMQELRERGYIVQRANAGRGRYNQHLAPPGWPDLEVFAPGGRMYFIEVKTPTGRVTTDQERMHEQLETMGYEVIIARSVEDV